MAPKLFESRKKNLIIGLLLVVLFTVLVPDLLLKSKFKINKEYSDIIDRKTSYEFGEYSQWPPFLTDSTFDLVRRILLF